MVVLTLKILRSIGIHNLNNLFHGFWGCFYLGRNKRFLPTLTSKNCNRTKVRIKVSCASVTCTELVFWTCE